jgi:uncharacterized protein with PQ loop repeat
MEQWYRYSGYIGSAFLALLLWPQVYTSYRTKNVEGLSGIFLGINMVTNIFWILYGVGFLNNSDYHNGIIILSSNTSIFIAGIFLLIAKYKYQKIKLVAN